MTVSIFGLLGLLGLLGGMVGQNETRRDEMLLVVALGILVSVGATMPCVYYGTTTARMIAPLLLRVFCCPMVPGTPTGG